jgi:surfeit locus 1 family protein
MSQRELPVVDLNRDRLTGPVAYRRATVRGQYDFDRELVIRGRLYRGTPGVHIVTPLRPEGADTAVLVNRGFVPTPDAGFPPSPLPYREPLGGTIEGIAIGIPDAGDGQPLETDRGVTWHRLDLSAVRARLPYPVAPYYLIEEADSTKTPEHTIKGHVIPIRIEPPPLDDGPHLSYAVQWFLIGGAALGFGIVFVRRRAEVGQVPD